MKNSKNYPLYQVQKFKNFKEMLELAEREAGDKIAFKYKVDNAVKEVTYSSFRNDTLYLGTALVDLGVSGKHIACIGENSYNWVTTYLTVLNSDGVFVPVDKELPDDDILNVLNSSDSEVLFYSAKYEPMLRERIDSLPSIKYYIGFERDTDDGKFLSYNKLMANGEKLYKNGDRRYDELESDPKELKLLVYTSGTTGISKGVMLSEHNLVSCVYYGLQISTVYDTCLSVLPYHHTYEAVAGLLVSLHHHSTICINDKIRSVLKNLNLFKPSYIYLVPAFAESFYKKIWATAKENGKDEALKKLIKISNGMRKCGIDMRKTLFASIHKSFGGRLKKIVCGGAPIRPEIGQFFDDIGINLINGYGITECSPLVSANRDNFNDWNTAGVCIPCVEVKIDNPNEDGNGEICVKGDTVMLGYYKNPEETAAVLHDGWFSTGDYGNLNEKGQLSITGRKKNLIVLNNGKNIYPEEIENYILSIPYVSEVVVYGIKDENGGESGLCAEVYLNPEMVDGENNEEQGSRLKKDIAAACRALPPYKQIAKIVIRAQEFVKTTSKKIKRNSITKQV